MGDVVDMNEKRQKRQERLAEADPLETRDQGQNAEFDTLLRMANEVWNWRDPDSIRALHTQVVICAKLISIDWQEPTIAGVSI